MNRTLGTVPLRNIFHPSDYSTASEIAFVHALRLALGAGATLHMLHFSEDPDRETGRFPGVRDTLARWNMIPPASGREAVVALGIEVRKVHSNHEDPVQASLGYLERHPCDLIVLSTHRREGRKAWFRRPVASPIARNSGGMALYLPEGVEGFVSRSDGSVSLRRVLFPAAGSPAPGPALDGCARLVRALGGGAPEATYLHVGEKEGMPRMAPPESTGSRGEWIVRGGDVVRTILEQATRPFADLIAMTTRGAREAPNARRPGTAEQVIQGAPCPVLAIQAGSPAD